MSASDPNNLTLSELFRMEIESQAVLLTEGLLELEQGAGEKAALQKLMRAAHSTKGASRIAGRELAVRIAHVMEEWFVRAQRGEISIHSAVADDLLQAVDLLLRIARVPEAETEAWDVEHTDEVSAFIGSLGQARLAPPESVEKAAPSVPTPEPSGIGSDVALEARTSHDRAVRVRAETLTRVLALAGESVVAARRLTLMSQRASELRRRQTRLEEAIELLRDSLGSELSGVAAIALQTLNEAEGEHKAALGEHLGALDDYERHSVELTGKLYDEVVALRMRPFSDAIAAVPRLVRDTARALGKTVHLEVIGASTPVDRDIAEQLDAPLRHLLRNAIDHGIETPEERQAGGKAPTGTIRLEARHAAGRLLITIADDGRGIDVESIRQRVIDRSLIGADAAGNLTDAELLEFLFLPAFSMRETVTEFSGRGVGLDVVKATLRELSGHVRAQSVPGRGTEFHLELPLTLSVLRAVIVDIDGDPYALPVARIERVLKVDRESIVSTEGRQHVTVEGRQIGLVTAHQILEIDAPEIGSVDRVPLLLLGEGETRYAVVVDAFLGERDLVVRPLDAHLGKVQDISAAALLDDGTPVFILDVDDLLRSIENVVSGGRIAHVQERRLSKVASKSILVVDDSLTVRELERKLLTNRGYDVEVAVDGMDAWNAVRTGKYDLIISDVDMPRMDGIELVTRLKNDLRLKTTPVVIVSYKDREDDRRRGLEAGADYYLTKGSFRDETLLRAVIDLIGEAAS